MDDRWIDVDRYCWRFFLVPQQYHQVQWTDGAIPSALVGFVGAQELVKTGAAMKTPLFFLDQRGVPVGWADAGSMCPGKHLFQWENHEILMKM